MVTIDNITIEKGDKLLLDKVSLFIASQDKIGLVGVNGAGKSSLLKAIVGEEEQDLGQINVSSDYAYLAQETHKEKREEVLGIEGVSKNDLTIEEYLCLYNGLNIEAWEISRMLNYLNLQHKTPSDKMGELSGGQLIKIEIIKLLFMQPGLLILDEPTNFLDIPSAEWLMGYLINYPNAVLAVSHDLRLMNRGLTRIWYLNERTKKVEVYNGNYDKFIQLKQQQEEWLVKQIKLEDKKYKKMIASAAVLSSRGSTSEKMKAAKLREKARVVKAETKEMTKGLKRSKKMKLRFDVAVTSGKKVLEVNGIKKSFGKNQVLRNISFEIERKNKLVVIGKNGVGKTTLLKIIAGKLSPDEGFVELGHNVEIGYYSQEYEDLDYDLSVIENMKADKRIFSMEDSQVRKILGGFLFSGDKIYQQVRSLSGGEKTRLAMAKLLAVGSNLLLLDEPTTYLDPASQKILLNALNSYNGTLVIVSHEPSFVRDLKPDHALLMPDEKVTYFDESYLGLVGIE
ncbi:ABC-F family ATP-binding cassette domain-containing protein [Candidatus Dojkabacteria bacterium]|uniref:ABC-F family ATP-binding cassette domain-containing protein n=1 Tax=Candidatus Dojkabacteria bacterium TaxID=2099670 RepID=A0A955KVH0_9BACT|nr:ABC-F family ATP-binding cassette domain-containing protein [Candidatus Dojkabacteria bacterium]MCB9790992.1 ABC-F family ATP-binding cassette domain-containing protein [Candidatus Nomurabacteria bacterium]